MITPSYSLTATERVLPRLALDFTTASLDPRVTFTRSGNTATVIDSSGVIVGVNADIPRFDFDPVTLACKGLLIEEARTNALLNSLIDGTSLATQSVTVTAAARTLSFYGTGQIVLSGAHSATVTGTGAYPMRTTLTFTPSAGSLTLTVTGTVQFAQLEVGAFATSFIPTAGSAVTRNADVATMTGTNFSDWYNASEGTFVVQAIPQKAVASTFPGIVSATNGTTSKRIYLYTNPSAYPSYAVDDTTNQAIININSAWVGDGKFAAVYKANDFITCKSATLSSPDTSGTVPTGLTQLEIGARNTSSYLNGILEGIWYYPQRLTNAQLQAFTN